MCVISSLILYIYFTKLIILILTAKFIYRLCIILKKFNESAYQRNDVDSIVSKLESSRDFIKEPNTGKYNWKYSYVYKNIVNGCKLIISIREQVDAFGTNKNVKLLTFYIEDSDEVINYISDIIFISNRLLESLVRFGDLLDGCVEAGKLISQDIKKIKSMPSEEDVEDMFIDVQDEGYKISSIDYGFYSKEWVYYIRDNRYSEVGLGIIINGFDNYEIPEDVDLSYNKPFIEQYSKFINSLNICINRFKNQTKLYINHKIYEHNGNVMVFIKIK